MKWLSISWKNILHRPLSAVLSILLLAFGTGVIILLMSASQQIEDQFTRNIRGIDMVVGAKGSPLQLLLSSVYHIDAPTGNISHSEFQKLQKHPLVKTAIPLSYGDNFEGYRIVGTDTNYLRHYNVQLTEGREWKETGEVVIGKKVADATGLKIGDGFSGNHGFHQEAEAHDHFTYKVVGILEPSGSVLDRLIIGDLESVWEVHSHDHEHESGEHEHEHEITAGIISFRSPMGMLSLPRMVNERTNMQAALPSIEMNRLFSLLGTGIQTLKILAYLIVLISAISVFVSLYQNLKDRKYELALLRSMGASRIMLASVVLLEGCIIAVLGYIFGMILGKAALFALSAAARDAYQQSLEIPVLTNNEMLLFPAILILGFLAAFLPALQAFRLNISKTLSHA